METWNVFPTIYDVLFCKPEPVQLGVRSFHLTINISVSWPTLVASALANEPSPTDTMRYDPPTCDVQQVSLNRWMHFVHRKKYCLLLLLYEASMCHNFF